LQLAIDIELFSPVNRNYREGEGRADDCLRHTGIYDLEPDGGAVSYGSRRRSYEHFGRRERAKGGSKRWTRNVSLRRTAAT
jgi:hypothetical protein